MADVIRILVVDPSTKFRLMMRAIMSPLDGMTVASGVDNGFEVLKELLEHQPDVIVMNANLPMLDGLTTLHHIMLRMPVPTVIIHDQPDKRLEIETDAYRFGAVAVINRPDNYLEDGSAWNSHLLETIEAAAVIKVQPLNESPVEEKQDTGEKYWSDRIIFCEECGTKNVLTPRQLAFDEPPCRSCGDPLRASTTERYKKFRIMTIMISSEKALGSLLHLAVHLPYTFPVAFVLLVEGDHIDKIVKFLEVRSPLRVLRLRDRCTVEGGTCYVGHVDEFVKLSNATNQPTFLVGPENRSEGEHPFQVLFNSVAVEMKENVVGVILGEPDEHAKAGQGIIEAGGGDTLFFKVGERLENRLLPGANRESLDDMTRDLLTLLDRKLSVLA